MRLNLLTRPALLLVTTIAAPLAAQHQFEALPAEAHFPPIRATWAFAVADFDKDGDPDISAGGSIYRNDGSGNYHDVTATAMPPGVRYTEQNLAEDFDGDGDVDLLLMQWDPRLLLNDGAGRFVDATKTHLPAGAWGGFVWMAATGDVDGDGDPDIVLARFYVNQTNHVSGRQNLIYINDGAGRFRDETTARLPAIVDASYTVVLSDLDGDGDADLVFGNREFRTGAPSSRVYMNDGAGRFVDLTGSRLPRPFTQPWLAHDLDADGDLDLLGGDGAMRNDGKGSFTNDPSLPGAQYAQLAITDLDGDGDDDVVYARRLFVGDGRGTFQEQSAGRGLERVSGPLATVDWDLDGDKDLLCGNGIRHVNHGKGTFSATHYSALPTPPCHRGYGTGIVMADLDGNRAPDLVLGNVLFLQIAGRFVDASDARLPDLPQGVSSSDLEVADVDGDGDPDLIRAAWGLLEILTNDGTGRFVAKRLATTANAIATADVDGDGDIDLCCTSNGSDSILINDGRGTFADQSAARLPQVGGVGRAVATADLNGDGAVDLVLGKGTWNTSHRNRIFLNNGAGVFRDVSATHLPAALDSTGSISTGDVDGDGDIDLLFGNTSQNRLYSNNGRGVFTDVTATHLPALGLTVSTSLGDLDEDGDLDLVLARANGRVARQAVLRNDGSGRFVEATQELVDLTPWYSSAYSTLLGDVDRDGDLDLLLSVGGSTSCSSGGPLLSNAALFTNLLRQLDAPQLALSGESYEIRAYARGGTPSLVHIAIPYIASAAADIALPPLGTLGIDPSTMIALPPFVIGHQNGVGSLRIDLPHVPSLAGTPLRTQAVVLRWPGNARLSNVTVDVFRR